MKKLKAVSVDEEHFQYLKDLSFIQPVTIPITIIHSTCKEVVPTLEDIFYCKLISSTLNYNSECLDLQFPNFCRLSILFWSGTHTHKESVLHLSPDAKTTGDVQLYYRGASRRK